MGITVAVDIQVVPNRWKLEINFTKDAVLMLSSMNLPDGIQVLYILPFDACSDETYWLEYFLNGSSIDFV